MPQDKLPYTSIQAHEEAEREFATLLERHRFEGRLGKVDHEYFSRGLRDRPSLLVTFRFVRKHLRNSFILDLGCGLGAMEALLCRESNGECVGLDENIFFLRLASQRMKLHDYSNVSMVAGDVRILPFRKETFNLVILHDVAFKVRINSFLGEVTHVLKKRGFFIFDVPLALFYQLAHVKRPFVKYSRDEVVATLRREGFEEECVYLTGLPPTLHEYFRVPEWLLRAISGLIVSLPERLQEILGEFWFTLVFVAIVK